MIRTMTATGARARNRVPGDSAFPGARPAGPGSASTGSASTGSASTGPAGAGQLGPALFDAEPNAVPLPSRVPSAALTLLRTARHGLAEADGEGDPGTRYICAHLAALRAAAAIVAARGEPGTGARRRRPRSVWELLPQVEPALAEWAAFFAAGAAKRAAAEAGLPRAASAQEADELLRDASTFLTVAERALGVESEPMLPLRSAS